MSGLDLLTRLRLHHETANIPVIMLTCQSNPEDVMEDITWWGKLLYYEALYAAAAALRTFSRRCRDETNDLSRKNNRQNQNLKVCMEANESLYHYVT